MKGLLSLTLLKLTALTAVGQLWGSAAASIVTFQAVGNKMCHAFPQVWLRLAVPFKLEMFSHNNAAPRDQAECCG
jgi:hypothetical protein